MKTIKIEKDIPVFYVEAENFPDGVPAAYEKLHALITGNEERRYFGISHPDEKGNIIYKAAAEELEQGEALNYGRARFTIQKGAYSSFHIKNHMSDADSIGNAFKKLLTHPALDPQGYCLECYVNYTDPDVVCMVPLKE